MITINREYRHFITVTIKAENFEYIDDAITERLGEKMKIFTNFLEMKYGIENLEQYMSSLDKYDLRFVKDIQFVNVIDNHNGTYTYNCVVSIEPD